MSNIESIRFKILKRKTSVEEGIKYNLMEIVSATAEHDRNASNKVTDSITLKIPQGVTQINIEALAENELNIFYRTQD